METSAVFDPSTNLMTVRIKTNTPTNMLMRLSTQLPSACKHGPSCMADLPMVFG